MTFDFKSINKYEAYPGEEHTIELRGEDFDKEMIASFGTVIEVLTVPVKTGGNTEKGTVEIRISQHAIPPEKSDYTEHDVTLKKGDDRETLQRKFRILRPTSP